MPEGRTVCPACSTLQPATASAPAVRPTAPAARPTAPTAPSAPTGFAGTATSWAPSPAAPPPRPARKASRAPLAIVVLLLVAAVGGGAVVLTRRGSDSNERAGGSTASTTTSTSAAPTTTTTAPVPITWSDVSDPATGIRWRMPAATAIQLPDVTHHALNPPLGMWPESWLGTVGDVNGIGTVQVSVWPSSLGATQASIDTLLARDREDFQAGDAPYPKALTIAGRPATVVDQSNDTQSTFVAIAVVDGALVEVGYRGNNGLPADPAVFEEMVASITKG